MNKVLLAIGLLTVVLSVPSYAQDLRADSLKTVNEETLELNREMARIKAKQDSLSRVRYKIESEQRAEQRALQLQQQQDVPATVVVPVKKYVNNGKNIIGLNTFQFLISGLDVSYERSISKKSSIVLSAAYHSMSDYDKNKVSVTSSPSSSSSSSSKGGPGNLFLVNGNVAYQGTKIQLQYRGYLFEEFPVMRGLYIGPYVFYKQDLATEVTRVSTPALPPYYNVTYTDTYVQYFAQAMGVGLDVGYQFSFLRYLTLNPFVGVGMIIPSTDRETSQHVNIDILNPYKEVMSVRTGIVVGFLF